MFSIKLYDIWLLLSNISPSRSKLIFKCSICLALRRKSSHFDANNSPTNTVLVGIPTNNSKARESSRNVTPNNNKAGEQEITMQLLYSEMVQIKNVITQALAKVKFLEEINSSLNKKITTLETKINLLEQKEKKCDVDIVGVPNVNNTNVKENPNVLITSITGKQLHEDEIVSCFVKSMKVNNKSQSPNIVCVKFSSLSKKKAIMSKMRERRNKITVDIFNALNNNSSAVCSGSNNSSSQRIYLSK